MAQYSIKDLEVLSGVKAHTLRIWEKRYGVVKPKRTPTNIRYYTDEDLKRIMNIGLLCDHGYKISHIAGLPSKKLTEYILEIGLSQKSNQVDIDTLVLYMLELNEEKFEQTIDIFINQNGVEKTFTKIIYPFFDKIGTLWQSGSINPAQEHFASYIIRQKLIRSIDDIIPEKIAHPKKYLLFLPEWELHEIGLLFYQYLIKKRGHQVIFLGQSVPYNDLKEIAKIRKTDAIVTFFITAIEDKDLQDYIADLSSDFSKHTIYISGRLVAHKKFKSLKNVLPICSVAEFINHI